MSASQRLKTIYKAFAVLGAGTASVSQYESGFRGEGYKYSDFGPQVFPKFLGNMHFNYNQRQQEKGRMEENWNMLKLREETPVFTTNIKFPPNIKW